MSRALWNVICIQLTPFGRDLRNSPDLLQFGHGDGNDSSPPQWWFRLVLNIVWFFTFGLALAVFHIAFATINAITLVLIPLAGVHLDLALVLLTPF